MIGSKQEIYSILRQFNPWWDGKAVPGQHSMTRTAFSELMEWALNPPAPRAILLSGARQVGKTTLFFQVIKRLIENHINPEGILYVTFDHPMLKLTKLDDIIKIWRELHISEQPDEYLFFDEIQYAENWQTWVKHQIDFNINQRIFITGSAIPMRTDQTESAMGRLASIKLPTLSFFEYLQLSEVQIPALPKLKSLSELLTWKEGDFIKSSELGQQLIPHFHDYLLRGGFPQLSLIDNVGMAQKLIREDIVDKILRRDMTALFAVRRILELEKSFLYLCIHDGGMLDITKLCNALDLKRPTVNNFIEYFESAHLIYRLPPYGYGKQILRGRHKIYMADPSLAGSIMLRGREILEDPIKLGNAVESAFFKHVFTRYYKTAFSFSYWKGPKHFEVDIIAESSGVTIPFEIKYKHSEIKAEDIKGLLAFCETKKPDRAYVITRELTDFGIMKIPKKLEGKRKSVIQTPIIKVPALLACFWLSQSEHEE